MSVTWGDLRNQIRRSILNDVLLSNWTDDQVHDYIGWALDRFAEHTALVKQVVYDDTSYDMSTATSFVVPDDIIDDVETTTMVEAIPEFDDSYFLDPADYTQGVSPYVQSTPIYWELPTGTLNISEPVGENGQLVLNYFAYYDTPLYGDDDFVISIPRWARKPVATLVGAIALENYAVQSATIDRWKDSSDSGNPEHNSLRAQQKFMLQQYEYDIARHPLQNRTNFFRRYDQWQK